MDKINCQVIHCSHNNDSVFYANCIDMIGKSALKKQETCCSSFLHQLHYSNLTNNTLGVGSCACLTCMAEQCMFNVDHQCNLDVIQVGGDHAQYYTHTACMSFKLKQ